MNQIRPHLVGLGLCGLIAAFVVLWPVGLARDYLNHLARNHIQGHLSSDPYLQQFYSLSFDFIPDMSMDLIVPWLSYLIGTYPAGAVMIWVGFVFAPLAGLVLSKALHGRVGWPALLGFLTIFNINMDWGFVNYNLSIGFSVLAFALWLKWRPGPQRALVFFPIGIFLCCNHAIAFLTFGYLALVWEVASFARGERGRVAGFIGRAISYDLIAMLGGLLYLYLSLQGRQDLPQAGDILFSLQAKGEAVIAATAFHNRALATWSSALIFAGLFFSLAVGWFRFAPKADWICHSMLALIILMPAIVFGIWGLHFRFTALWLILTGAGLVPTAKFNQRHQRLLGGLAGIVGGVLILNGGAQMSRINKVVDDTRIILAAVPEGRLLLTTISSDYPFPAASMNVSATAVIDRSGYVPDLFTNTSMVDVNPAYVDLHMPQAWPIPQADLLALAELPATHSMNGYWNLSYAHGWTERFEYLIHFKAVGDAPLTHSKLCMMAAQPEIVLYQIGDCLAH